MQPAAYEVRDLAENDPLRPRSRWPLARGWPSLPGLLAGIFIALASPPRPATADELTEKPASPDSRADAGSQGKAGDAEAEPPPSPSPASSNRASVRRYVEGIDPSSWLRRYGDVEKRKRR